MFVILSIAALAACVALLVLLILRLYNPSSGDASDSDWEDDFSIEKYRPMLRLLAEDDFEFLASQCGETQECIRRLRAERRRIFRAYLKSLSADFYHLHNGLKALMVHSSQDRPDLAQKLLKQRVSFNYALLCVEYRLFLHAFGLSSVDVGGLLGSVDALRLEVRAFSPQNAAA